MAVYIVAALALMFKKGNGCLGKQRLFISVLITCQFNLHRMYTNLIIYTIKPTGIFMATIDSVKWKRGWGSITSHN